MLAHHGRKEFKKRYFRTDSGPRSNHSGQGVAPVGRGEGL